VLVGEVADVDAVLGRERVVEGERGHAGFGEQRADL
jgi:hypothetical protein